VSIEYSANNKQAQQPLLRGNQCSTAAPPRAGVHLASRFFAAHSITPACAARCAPPASPDSHWRRLANAGQWDARAAFAAPTFAGTLFVTTDGQLVYSLPPARKTATGGWALSESFVSATGKRIITAPVGDQPGATRTSDFTHTHAKASAHSTSGYQRVNLGDIYPGVNVQLRATRNNAGANVEKIFTVAPQHDPKQIQIKLEGANKLEVSAQGELIAHTGNGPVAFTAPIAFQVTTSGERTPVPVAYALDTAQQRYGFTLGDYDAPARW